METHLDAESLPERANAHAVGLLQNPFSADGSSGAFLGLPHHRKSSGAFISDHPIFNPVPVLDPFTDGGKWPEGCPRDPFALVKEDLAPLSDSIRELVATDHPVLSKAAEHFFAERHGKRFRPTIVMLIGKATAPDPINHNSGESYEKQGALGQITELIHVASLIHDDVLDEADTRRGGSAVHKLYSNKVAVIAGDYLLARASVLLARLQSTEVTEIMSTALESLVQGEIMQIRTAQADLLDLMTYLRKSYHKTASLICDASKASAILGGHAADSPAALACEEYGFHLGLAYQIIDDVLDFTGASETLGKPAMADVSLGLATAPVLLAAEAQPQLKPLILRKFKSPGDPALTLQLVQKTDGVKRARELALFHGQSAVRAICRLPPSEHRAALIALAHLVLARQS